MKIFPDDPFDVVLCYLRISQPEMYHHEVECHPWVRCPQTERGAHCRYGVPVFRRQDADTIQRHLFYQSKRKPIVPTCGGCKHYPCQPYLQKSDKPCIDFKWPLSRMDTHIYCPLRNMTLEYSRECYECYISRDRRCPVLQDRPVTIAYRGKNLGADDGLWDFRVTVPHEYREITRFLMVGDDSRIGLKHLVMMRGLADRARAISDRTL